MNERHSSSKINYELNFAFIFYIFFRFFPVFATVIIVVVVVVDMCVCVCLQPTMMENPTCLVNLSSHLSFTSYVYECVCVCVCAKLYDSALFFFCCSDQMS